MMKNTIYRGGNTGFGPVRSRIDCQHRFRLVDLGQKSIAIGLYLSRDLEFLRWKGHEAGNPISRSRSCLLPGRRGLALGLRPDRVSKPMMVRQFSNSGLLKRPTETTMASMSPARRKAGRATMATRAAGTATQTSRNASRGSMATAGLRVALSTAVSRGFGFILRHRQALWHSRVVGHLGRAAGSAPRPAGCPGCLCLQTEVRGARRVQEAPPRSEQKAWQVRLTAPEGTSVVFARGPAFSGMEREPPFHQSAFGQYVLQKAFQALHDLTASRSGRVWSGWRRAHLACDPPPLFRHGRGT